MQYTRMNKNDTPNMIDQARMLTEYLNKLKYETKNRGRSHINPDLVFNELDKILTSKSQQFAVDDKITDKNCILLVLHGIRRIH